MPDLDAKRRLAAVEKRMDDNAVKLAVTMTEMA
jgi:hypothetical protein